MRSELHSIQLKIVQSVSVHPLQITSRDLVVRSVSSALLSTVRLLQWKVQANQQYRQLSEKLKVRPKPIWGKDGLCRDAVATESTLAKGARVAAHHLDEGRRIRAVQCWAVYLLTESS